MANLKIESTSNKVIKTLEIKGEVFTTETEKTETGSWCKCCFESQLEQAHPDWMEEDEVYEAVETIDNMGDELDVMGALQTIEEQLE